MSGRFTAYCASLQEIKLVEFEVDFAYA